MHDPRFDPLPLDKAKYIERLARDLAWGVLNGIWKNTFYISGSPMRENITFSTDYNQKPLKDYLNTVWDNKISFLNELLTLGYIHQTIMMGGGVFIYPLTQKGLQLAQVPQPGPIFISYRRSESTPFALLIRDRLGSNGIIPFLDNQSDLENQDTSLKAGSKWKDVLRQAIESRDYLILLIGPTTLLSSSVQEEISIAQVSGKKIIPVWHRGFNPNDALHFPENEVSMFKSIVEDTNAIRIVEEEPQQYENAIAQLMTTLRLNP